jgi:hypothetical protein
MEPNLAESIYIRSSIKFLHFVPFCQQIWPPRAILVSDWLMLRKYFPLKLLGQMEPNLLGSIYAEKRAITPRWVIKIAGHVDLDKLNMFSVNI